jgi:hypothetical protein
MKVISFDIGIKNMAYCVLSPTQNADAPITIHDWNVLSMIEEAAPAIFPCNCMIAGKNKKVEPKICNKAAKYSKNDQYFCDRHAKIYKQYIIPTKKHTSAFIKKQKVPDLVALCNTHMLLLNMDAKTLKKDKLIEILSGFYKQMCFDPIVTLKSKNANEIDLIHIGKSIKRLFDLLPDIDSITHVLIENQISPIANRMKTIQGMLAQYFIMKNDNIHIDFVSSSHKLNQFKQIEVLREPTNAIVHAGSGAGAGTSNPAGESTKTNPHYKAHKSDGITYCQEILEKNAALTHWNLSMNTRKKDDLADAFLQGMWYFKQQNIICYADDLKIKLV